MLIFETLVGTGATGLLGEGVLWGVRGEAILLSLNRFDIYLGRWEDLVIAGVFLRHLGEVVGDEVENVFPCELTEALEEGLTDGDGDTVDDDGVEGGGQCVGVEVNRVMEGCHAFDVGLQSVDCRDKLFNKFSDCLQGLIQLTELFEGITSENMNVAKVTDKFFLEILPVVNVDKGALLVIRHGLVHSLGLGCVIPFGSFKHFGVALDPWEEIIT